MLLVCFRNDDRRQQHDGDDAEGSDDVHARAEADDQRAGAAENRILQDLRRDDGDQDSRDARRFFYPHGTPGRLQEQVYTNTYSTTAFSSR